MYAEISDAAVWPKNGRSFTVSRNILPILRPDRFMNVEFKAAIRANADVIDSIDSALREKTGDVNT